MPLSNLENIISNLERFDLEAEQLKIIEANKDELSNLQATQWGETSKDYAGREIKLLDNPQYNEGYRPFTIEKKKREGIGLGSVTSRITLFQTGALYKELFTTITSGKFTISSSVPYFKTLMRRTGDVAGLDYDIRQEFVDTFLVPAVRIVLKEKTGLVI